jgi:endoglucanase
MSASEGSRGGEPPPRGAMTRRALLAAGAAGAAAGVLAAHGCGGGVPAPVPLPVAPGPRRPVLRGVNTYTLNYSAGAHGPPTGEPAASYAYLAARGHRLVRLPFEWGLVQPALGRPLDPAVLPVLDREVAAIADAGMRVVLDVHSSGRHPKALRARHRFGAGISTAQFADVWLRLSDRFAGDQRIHAYDLMNEPFDMPDAVWQHYSQAAVHALRAHGDRTLLWIEGNQLSLAQVWREHQPMPWIDDPLDHHVYSAHCYPGDAANRPQPAPRPAEQDAFLRGLRDFVAWLSQYGCRGSIGEIGWPSARRVGPTGAAEWNRLGEAWYQMADAGRLDVTYFGASSAYDNWLWAYDARQNSLRIPGLTIAESQAAIIEAHPSRT